MPETYLTDFNIGTHEKKFKSFSELSLPTFLTVFGLPSFTVCEASCSFQSHATSFCFFFDKTLFSRGGFAVGGYHPLRTGIIPPDFPSNSNSRTVFPSNPDSRTDFPSNLDRQTEFPSNPDSRTEFPSNPDGRTDFSYITVSLAQFLLYRFNHVRDSALNMRFCCLSWRHKFSKLHDLSRWSRQ